MKAFLYLLISLFLSACHFFSTSERNEILSDAAYEEGDLEAAKKLIDKAITDDPSIARQHFKRGLINAEMGKLEEAIRDYNNAIKLDSLDYLAYSNKGEIYTRMGDYEKALDAHNKSIATQQSVSGYRDRAKTYFEMGLLDKAIEDCNKAIEIDSTDQFAYYDLAEVLKEITEYEEALKNYNKALSLTSEESTSERLFKASVYGSRGLCYFEIGKMTEACEDWHAAIATEKSLTPVHNLIEQYCK